MIYVLNKENFKFIGRFDNMKFAKEMLNKPKAKKNNKDIGMPEYKSVKHEQVDLAALYKRIEDGNKWLQKQKNSWI